MLCHGKSLLLNNTLINIDEGINRLVGLCYPSQYSGKRENNIKSCVPE
jgi:hypothetical protein